MEPNLNSLPSTWPLVPLGAICQVGAGNGAPQGDTYFSGGTHPFVRMQDVGRSTAPYLTTTVDRLNDLAIEKHALRLWPANSLLIPKSGASVALNKRALLRKPSYVVSHLAVLVPGPLIDPEYLYHISCTLDMMRLALDPAYPSLRTSDLARLRIPLPPLSEQQRIVEILREAEEIRDLRAEVDIKTAELIPAMFFEHFEEGRGYDFRPLHGLADVVSGVAIGRKTKGMTVDVPYMRVANVQAGFIDLSEIKTTPATDEEVIQFALKAGDILLTEGGDFDKLGRGCLWDGLVDPCIHQNHVFRVRPYPGKLNSRFFSHYLQSAKAKHYFLRCAKKTTNLASINLNQLKALPVPNISIENQEHFERQIQIANECSVANESKLFNKLAESLSAHAFSGQLTADWREVHSGVLAAEARERDASLKKAGAAISLSRRATISEEKNIWEIPTDGIYADLNREQRDLVFRIGQRVGGVDYARYFTAEGLSKSIDGPLRRNPQAIEGHLAVLAARGLIIPVSREEQTEDTGEFVFGNAYRLPRRDKVDHLTDEKGDRLTDEKGNALVTESVQGDHARARELTRLAAQLEKERSLS